MSNRFTQDNDDKLYRAFDWQYWLSDGESILTAEITCDSGDINITHVAVDGSKVTYQVSGGVAGETYTISCKITTSGGETIQRSIFLFVDRK